MRFAARNALVVLVFVALACGGASAQCTPEWARGMFPLQGLNGDVNALCVYNGELYAGGEFTTRGRGNRELHREMERHFLAGCRHGDERTIVPCTPCASTTASSTPGASFTTAGGVSANRIAKWNGISWQAVGTGMSYDCLCPVRLQRRALCRGLVHHCGRGDREPHRQVERRFLAACRHGDERRTSLCPVRLQRRALRRGAFHHGGRGNREPHCQVERRSWQAVGTGMNDGRLRPVRLQRRALRRRQFTTAGGVSREPHREMERRFLAACRHGDGRRSSTPCASTMASSTPGADFTTAGGVTANHIAKWNGVSWQAVGTGMDGTVSTPCASTTASSTPGAISPPRAG